MTANASLEERMIAAEEAIAARQKQIANSQSTNWLQQITGSFKDEPTSPSIYSFFELVFSSKAKYSSGVKKER